MTNDQYLNLYAIFMTKKGERGTPTGGYQELHAQGKTLCFVSAPCWMAYPWQSLFPLLLTSSLPFLPLELHLLPHRPFEAQPNWNQAQICNLWKGKQNINTNKTENSRVNQSSDAIFMLININLLSHLLLLMPSSCTWTQVYFLSFGKITCFLSIQFQSTYCFKKNLFAVYTFHVSSLGPQYLQWGPFLPLIITCLISLRV